MRTFVSKRVLLQQRNEDVHSSAYEGTPYVVTDTWNLEKGMVFSFEKKGVTNDYTLFSSSFLKVPAGSFLSSIQVIKTVGVSLGLYMLREAQGSLEQDDRPFATMEAKSLHEQYSGLEAGSPVFNVAEVTKKLALAYFPGEAPKTAKGKAVEEFALSQDAQIKVILVYLNN